MIIGYDRYKRLQTVRSIMFRTASTDYEKICEEIVDTLCPEGTVILPANKAHDVDVILEQMTFEPSHTFEDKLQLVTICGVSIQEAQMRITNYPFLENIVRRSYSPVKDEFVIDGIKYRRVEE